ncbi:lysylphosphatidylglycerol synthase domain-containing protein [Melissococcus plutonius]|uniref:Phosphatidylglycerol lysyltransferase n=1 Tax=Melissococcus plutonius TaxID=33970 RepID=A0A2Z5Y2V7_9ENTE|nr:lysylphosphatidylglycerol synthase domain-containing protein [Melissococcus plutonius]BAL62199.1 hypothetical protein MPD5_0968 [Melissococcus plutonius DAT561]MCV2497970.1 lysylphosphatidylglycerol synthase domain-containing protein [Melissococcus plutonius]MCV2500774.1 lysylphosphatidylglycerol synthase domain-containing protein [Melissococcus plutonius]MCV2505311.1 lysylphosphatidylglycerol synthase domain-containing protein [Melissococcus plutonius]MCV2506585.1 lysylphosphatidylglycerol
MKKNLPLKILMNSVLLILIIGLIFYTMDSSLTTIFTQLLKTSWLVILAIILLGFIYQWIEGHSIKAIAKYFQPKFSIVDGFFTSCQVAFYRVISFGTATFVSEVYFYKKQGIAISKGIGISAMHLIMYKSAIIFWAIVGFIFKFSSLHQQMPKMIPFLIFGIIITGLIVLSLLLLSSSLNVQIFFVYWTNKWIKHPKLRSWVDNCNLQIYSLRETVQTITKNRSAFLPIFGWNIIKLLFWYMIPYVFLVIDHPKIDFFLVLFLTNLAIILSGIIPTPAGIGSFEFIYLLLFTPLVGEVDAIASVLIYRFGSFVFPFLIGMFYTINQKYKELKIDILNNKKNKEYKLK